MSLDLRERMQKYPLQTTAAHAPWLFGLLLDAPLMGVLMRWPDTLHAVTAEAVVRGGRTFESACGIRGLRLVEVEPGSGLAASWPPSTRGLPQRLSRCSECWELTGRKRPRSRFRPGNQP